MMIKITMLNRLKLTLTALILLAAQLHAWAQVPFVKSVSKSSAHPQETISLQGINFGTNAANVQVMFGNAAAVPTTITDQYLEVAVPYGAAFEDVNVINTSTGLGGYSKNGVLSSYGGINPFDITQLTTQSDFASESDLYDMAAADFDGDGKLDIVTANQKSTSVSLFLNTSTPGSVSFTKTLITPSAFTVHATAADLNGDGKTDFILSELNGARLFIYKNTSTVGSPSFSQQIITITGAKVSQVRVIDFDLNGHPDIVVTDQSGSKIFVASNQSSLSTISFAAATLISLGGSSAMDGIAVGDLDGDGLPEIATSEFQSPTGIIFVLKNQSVPGALNFATPLSLMASTAISNVRIGDLDGDGKADLAASALLASSVLIFPNQSTSSAIQFASAKTIPAIVKPWGLDFGDVDGDGKIDIAVCSITQKTIAILNNKSTAGSFVFQNLSIPTTYITRFIKIVDLDNDSRPDLGFTSIDDGVNNIPASKVSVFLNHNCVVPAITPVGPLTVCSSFTQRLTATNSPGSTYEWFKNAASLGAPGTTNYLDITATGTYTVRLVNGSCSQTSTGVSITVAGGSAPTATPAAVPPVCIGGTLNLSVNDVGASAYLWSGPAFATPQSGLTVSSTNFVSSQAGKYTLTVMVGSCITQQASVIVDVVDVPNVSVLYSGSNIICEGQTKLFSIFPTVNGFNYQWAEQTAGDISGETNSTFTASASGSYFVKLTSTANPSCPVVQSAAKGVRVAKIPVVDFVVPSVACLGQVVSFTDQSTIDSDTVGLHVSYQWDFGGQGTGTGLNPTFTFPSAQSNANIKLTVAYINQSCPSSSTKLLTIQSAPALVITSPSGVFSFCPSDSVLVQATAGFDTYLWSDGTSGTSAYAKQAGNITVQVTKGSCQVSALHAIAEYVVDVTASADPSSIKKGASSQLSATGLTTYLWKPNKTGISDSTIVNPTVTPTVTTAYTVTGIDANGCTGEATVQVFLGQENSFILSPDNNDGINDTWQIVETGKQCNVSIYDERGLKIYEANPYSNDWKGISSNGKVLPSGAYYYVMKCDNSGSNYTAGCINIVR